MSDEPGAWLHFGVAPNKAYRAPEIVVDPSGRYSMAFIEFDDQGWYHSLDQRKALADFLDARAHEDLLILVFIHGWKHNAEPGDTNVEKFQGLVDATACSEQARQGGRHTLGVYLSWRGLSLRGNPIWQNLSFYTRKNAALRVAIGSVRDTLALLNTYRVGRHWQQPGPSAAGPQPHSETEGTRLFLAGHSFGGLILFSALSEYLMESTYSSDIISPFGDLVILVNPAFEATRYQPLAIALSKRKTFADGQRPVFIAFAATNDDATGKAFPLGRRFGTWREATRENSLPPPFPPDAQRQANLNTIGHLDWLRTHKLTATPAAKEQRGAGRRTAGADFHAEARDFEAFNRDNRPDRRLKPNWTRTYKSGAELTHLAGDLSSPFWVVETSPDVIDGHNGIFLPVFTGFLGQLVDDRMRPV